MQRARSEGFTLVEMSLVIAVFGILATIAVLGTSRMIRSNRLVGATNTLVADLRYARGLAASHRRDYRIVFQSGGYSLVRVASADTVLRRICPSGITCSATANPTFFAWGLTAPSTITLSSESRSHILQLAANGNVTR